MWESLEETPTGIKVVIPYTPPRQELGVTRGLSPATEAFGRRIGARFVDVSGFDFAYYELLRDLWAAGESFIYVEHDVVPDRGLLPELWDCPEPYCTPGLSCEVCAKFGESLMRRWPKLIEEMGATSCVPPSPGPIHWGSVTLVLSSELCRRGVQPHPHDGGYDHPGGGMRLARA
jgi:hypothetical protein